MSRDALMFRAGQAASLRKVRQWQAASTGLGVILALALALRILNPTPRAIYVDKAPPASGVPQQIDQAMPPGREPGGLAYVSVRDDVLLRGVETLRPSPPGPTPADPPRELKWLRSAPPPAARTGLLGTLENLLSTGA